jgi:hypothetical protein
MYGDTQMAGIDLAPANVDKMPPLGVPAPLPSLAMGAMAVPNVPDVLIAGAPAHNLATVIPMTLGDAAALGGVASGTTMGPSLHMTGAWTALVGGAPATTMGSVSLQNTNNAPGVRGMPSQTKVAFF